LIVALVHADLVTFDVPEPDVSARFWCAVLAAEITEREDEGRWVAVSGGSLRGRLGFQRGEVRPGGVHLDLSCAASDLDAEVERLLAAGAVLLRPARRESYGVIVNMACPDGYAFDVCAYGG
jgi:predicted enzyme related to lactoylglutathione lyase